MFKEKDFYNKTHYNRYLHAVSLATKINKYFDNGYRVFDDITECLEKFTFPDNDKYTILSLDYVNYLPTSVCDNGNGKIWIDCNKKQMNELFKDFRAVQPCNFINCITGNYKET